MSKTIPSALLSHKAQEVTTRTWLLRLVLRDGTEYGFTELDRDVTYDAGGGALTYLAAHGFTPSNIASNASLGVDNADLTGLFADVDTAGAISEVDVRAGRLDFAEVWVYEVNWADLSMGHEIVARGTVGEVRVEDGQYRAEFRSLAQQLKQTVTELYSLTCRAGFGDARCGVDLEAEWVEGAVTAVGAELDLVFTDTSLTQATGYFVPGLLEWLTGDNAGRSVEVEAFAVGVVTLRFPVYYPIQIGDTFRIRRDCDKRLATCRDRFSNVLNFRGEPHIPVADEGSISTPGASL